MQSMSDGRRLALASFFFCTYVQAEHTHTAPEQALIIVEAQADGSLSQADAAKARKRLGNIAGSAELVDAKQWQDSEARTLKDVLDYVPGVIAQPKWGEDTRLSIRGSGLSRNFHLRGVGLLVDGIPLNAADGSADFQEIDPTAFAYSEVFKGANALRYGANALGGAINFVSPTAHTADRISARIDTGSFGLSRQQISAGGQLGALDAYVAASHLEHDGFRDHSSGQSQRATANLGWRATPNFESRLYLFGADIEQQIPGSVSRDVALNQPKTAAANNLRVDYQRNIQSWRVAQRNILKFGETTVELGFFAVEKQLIHPIFQYLDYQYNDRGAFTSAQFDQALLGHKNAFVIGAQFFGGRTDNTQFQNLPGGQAGDLLSASADRASNLTLYAENIFELQAGLSLIAGLQYVDAERERNDRFNDATDTSGKNSYDFFNPKLGVLWQALPEVQLFANVSRSAEAPSFGELNFTNAALSDTRAQRAATLEVGARGRSARAQWSVAVYRAEIRDEFQFIDLGGGNFSVSNADETVHQGLEVALGWTFAEKILADGDQALMHLSYTFNDFFFDKDNHFSGNELPGAPRHYVRTSFEYQHPSGLSMGPDLEWIPQAYDVDNANSRQTKEYALVGFKLGYQAHKNWSLFMEARNLADIKYIASSSVVAIAADDSALYEPGNGRAVIGGVRLSWN